MQHYRQQLAQENSTPALFAQRPTLWFRSAQSQCPTCQAPLAVLKTRAKTVHTLPLGTFTAQETLLQCPRCAPPTTVPAEALRALVPPGCRCGYDVIRYAGEGLFRRHRRAPEIVAELAAQNIQLSSSQVAYLGQKFIVYLALAHRHSAPRLQALMQTHGGYMGGAWGCLQGASIR